MIQLSTREFSKHLANSVNRAAYGKERVYLQRRGKTVAAIVPVEDAELLQRLEDRKAKRKPDAKSLKKLPSQTEAADARAVRRVLARVKSGKERVYSLAEAEARLAAAKG